MRLVTKVALVFAEVISLSVVLNSTVLRTTVVSAIAQIESETADPNVLGAVDAIENDLRLIFLPTKSAPEFAA